MMINRIYNFQNIYTRILITVFICIVFILSENIFAEIRLNDNTPRIRIRLGDNANGNVNDITYIATFPTGTGITGFPGSTIDSNTLYASGTAAFPIRVVTDIDSGPPAGLTKGTFSYDSSNAMDCVTLPTCNGVSIPFSKISWIAQDGDVHNTIFRYDDSGSQFAHEQTDLNLANNTGLRHRNRFKYTYDNDLFLPAGTYFGSVTLFGIGAPP